MRLQTTADNVVLEQLLLYWWGGLCHLCILYISSMFEKTVVIVNISYDSRQHNNGNLISEICHYNQSTLSQLSQLFFFLSVYIQGFISQYRVSCATTDTIFITVSWVRVTTSKLRCDVLRALRAFTQITMTSLSRIRWYHLRY